MLIGYVSDERYLALGDVLLEFQRDGQSIEARSRASGAVHADLAPGPYKVYLFKPGYGAKIVDMVVKVGEPYHFRLLTDCLLGYASGAAGPALRRLNLTAPVRLTHHLLELASGAANLTHSGARQRLSLPV